MRWCEQCGTRRRAWTYLLGDSWGQLEWWSLCYACAQRREAAQEMQARVDTIRARAVEQGLEGLIRVATVEVIRALMLRLPSVQKDAVAAAKRWSPPEAG